MKPGQLTVPLVMAAVMALPVAGFGQSLAELEAAAKAEGALNVIALPHDWCGYGEIIAAFKAKYPEITMTELDPDAGSADELEAVRSNKGNTGPQVPDVLDIGLPFGPQAKDEGLLQPYKVSTWDTIPETAKDPEGYWYGDYYGVAAFAVNTDLVAVPPKSWADLLKPEYAGAVALGGDPRTSNNAMMAILASGISRGAEPGKASGEAGLGFFAELHKAGNFVPMSGGASTLAQGATPIVIDWDYNHLSARDQLAGNPPVEVIVPSDGVVAGIYVQAISAYAPHPNAAKLWMEYLYSDEGQIGYMKGYCHPIRFDDLVARGMIPAETMARMPAAEAYEAAVFPTLEQQMANKAAVTGGWDTVVGANVN